MARILITCFCDDSEVISDALNKYDRRDLYVAVDNTPTNRYKAEALGIDSGLNLVGLDADHSLYDEVIECKLSATKKTTPKPKKEKKAKKPATLEKEIEAVVDEQTE